MNIFMNNIGIVGAGIMGCGVAQCFSKYGYSVMLLDTSDEALNLAKVEIKKNIRMQMFFDKTLHSENEILEKISFSREMSSLTKANFIIENIPEIYIKKKQLYNDIAPYFGNGTILLVNTSCLSITEMASLLSCPERVIGVHFMNPVYIKQAVEVIIGFHTSQTTIAKTKRLISSIEKEAIIVKDLPGFVSNRISHLFINEAAFVVQDQVASPRDVDNIFKKCYGHKMGPLETADLIGLDTVVNSLEVLYNSYQDSKFRCCPLLKKMVAAGLLGQKSGKGFFKYESFSLKQFGDMSRGI